jgi:hypothetical protein
VERDFFFVASHIPMAMNLENVCATLGVPRSGSIALISGQWFNQASRFKTHLQMVPKRSNDRHDLQLGLGKAVQVPPKIPLSNRFLTQIGITVLIFSFYSTPSSFSNITRWQVEISTSMPFRNAVHGKERHVSTIRRFVDRSNSCILTRRELAKLTEMNVAQGRTKWPARMHTDWWRFTWPSPQAEAEVICLVSLAIVHDMTADHDCREVWMNWCENWRIFIMEVVWCVKGEGWRRMWRGFGGCGEGRPWEFWSCSGENNGNNAIVDTLVDAHVGVEHGGRRRHVRRGGWYKTGNTVISLEAGWKFGGFSSSQSRFIPAPEPLLGLGLSLSAWAMGTNLPSPHLEDKDDKLQARETVAGATELLIVVDGEFIDDNWWWYSTVQQCHTEIQASW